MCLNCDISKEKSLKTHTGSGHVTAARVKTPLEGILEGVNGDESRLVISDSDNIDKAVKASRDADVAIVLVGTSSQEGTVFDFGVSKQHTHIVQTHR